MIPENPEHRTEAVMGTHQALEESPLNQTIRLIHADALEDAGAEHEAALQRHIARQEGRVNLPPDMVTYLRSQAGHYTGLAHLATTDIDRGNMISTERAGNSNRARSAHMESAYATAAMYHDAAARFHDDRGSGRISRHGRTGRPIGKATVKLHRLAAQAHRVAELHQSALAKVIMEGER